MSLGLVSVILFSITAEGLELEVLFRDISFLIPFQIYIFLITNVCLKIVCKISLYTSLLVLSNLNLVICFSQK